MEFDLRRRPNMLNEKAPAADPEQLRRQKLVIQRRLQVGAANDPHERDADAVADDVVRRLLTNTTASTDEGRPFARPTMATRIRRMDKGGSPADGFTAPPDVESRIQGARGSGTPLDPGTRSKFEGAMGVDLGAVRVHHDRSADQLNRAVSAKAFTTGDDVFFSSGAYEPASKQGQHLLAHELAHTVQQSGAARRSTIRRMSVQNTDFSKTTTVNVFSGGASGSVAEFSDGAGSIIVKVDQKIGNEVAVADTIISQGGKKNGNSKGFSVGAPASRVASPSEVQAIKSATNAHIGTADPRNFLTGLDSGGPVIIAERLAGEKFHDLLDKAKLTRPDGNGGLEANPEAEAFKMLTQAGPLLALAKAAPADILMGMFDRIVGTFNGENFIYDQAKQAFNFVDNTQNGAGGFLTSVQQKFGSQVSTYTSQTSFTDWCTSTYVLELQNKDFGAIATRMANTLSSGLASRLNQLRKGEGKIIRQFAAHIEPYKPMMVATITKGLKAGHATLMGQLKNPVSLAAGVAADKRFEVVESLSARYFFLKGASAAEAWPKATAQATKLVPRTVAAPKAPVRPNTPTPALPKKPATPFAGAQPRGQGARATGGGHRMPQLPKVP